MAATAVCSGVSGLHEGRAGLRLAERADASLEAEVRASWPGSLAVSLHAAAVRGGGEGRWQMGGEGGGVLEGGVAGVWYSSTAATA